ncbi:Protein unc-93 A [Mactra antiquata]
MEKEKEKPEIVMEVSTKSEKGDLGKDGIIVTFDENKTISKMSKVGVYRNLIVISVAFMLGFSAYNSFSSLQSSLNKDDGLGTTGLAISYAMMLLSSLLVTPVTMSRFTPKWIMVVSLITLLIYVATGFYPSWYTVIPASIIVGIGLSHLWLASQAYITDIAKHYALMTNTKPQDKLNFFLGIFYAFTYSCNIWGNLASSFVFETGEDNSTVDVDVEICGPNFCPYLGFNLTNIIDPSTQQVYTYTEACCGFVVLALVIMTFLVTDISAEPTSSNVWNLVQQVTKQMCTSKTQQLLFFPSLLGGMAFGFVSGDFTQAYVSCPYGVKNVGFALVVYGISQSIGSVVLGKLNQYTGHLAIFIFGCIVQIVMHLTLLLWIPESSQQYVIYILATMFGIAGAVNVPVIAGLYNLYFTKNRAVALSSFRMIYSAGGAMAMGYSNWLCARYKIYILSSTVGLSFISIIGQHIRHKRKEIKVAQVFTYKL